MEKVKTRKPHTKSRNGCLPCKVRHVKCDETRPACVNCDKYGSNCEYLPIKKRAGSIGPYPVSTPSSTEGSTPVILTTQEPVLNIPQLQLLHHFTMETAKTLVLEPGSEEVFQSYMIKVAFNYTFLLHGSLALAALHLSRLDQHLHSQYLQQAEQHHNAALAQFRAEVSDIDESNFEAVLLFAFILFPYSCAFPPDTTEDPRAELDHLVQSLVITRGVRPLVTQVFEKMLNSTIARLMPSYLHGINVETEEVPAETELVKLRSFSMITANLFPPDISEAYNYAIRMLEVLFKIAARQLNRPSSSLARIWVHHLSPRFMELLSERQPGALIIFAHYAVLLQRCEPQWFLSGCAEQIVHIADSFVPSEWKDWLDWPREQIMGSPSVHDVA
ncbi:hypothetical protein P154DRAFT_340136 [Amniculicola lignicola CBS 123094]|uniref:Zn(2)-C6 fungal-type domain-containing protein n=1 Tax=Amniculicola lignicola CBS 123094 TaxID=1392246 RepID=A0A6A5W683_9PLEO|nr:hypothetical protein P154DRAFT_340136 [Amniculicola lignicola CBS 123094]